MSNTQIFASAQNALYDANTMILAQTLDLTQKTDSAPKINIQLPNDVESLIQKIAIFFLALWLGFIIYTGAKVGKQGGSVIQGVGGWPRLIIATTLLVACLKLNTTIQVLNVIVAGAWWVLQMALSVLPGG